VLSELVNRVIWNFYVFFNRDRILYLCEIGEFRSLFFRKDVGVILIFRGKPNIFRVYRIKFYIVTSQGNHRGNEYYVNRCPDSLEFKYLYYIYLIDSITLAILLFSLPELAIRIFLIYLWSAEYNIISLNISSYEINVRDTAFTKRISNLYFNYVLTIHHNRMTINSYSLY
jgi:hypothetical protein